MLDHDQWLWSCSGRGRVMVILNHGHIYYFSYCFIFLDGHYEWWDDCGMNPGPGIGAQLGPIDTGYCWPVPNRVEFRLIWTCFGTPGSRQRCRKQPEYFKLRYHPDIIQLCSILAQVKCMNANIVIYRYNLWSAGWLWSRWGVDHNQTLWLWSVMVGPTKCLVMVGRGHPTRPAQHYTWQAAE